MMIIILLLRILINVKTQVSKPYLSVNHYQLFTQTNYPLSMNQFRHVNDSLKLYPSIPTYNKNQVGFSIQEISIIINENSNTAEFNLQLAEDSKLYIYKNENLRINNLAITFFYSLYQSPNIEIKQIRRNTLEAIYQKQGLLRFEVLFDNIMAQPPQVQIFFNGLKVQQSANIKQIDMKLSLYAVDHDKFQFQYEDEYLDNFQEFWVDITYIACNPLPEEQSYKTLVLAAGTSQYNHNEEYDIRQEETQFHYHYYDVYKPPNKNNIYNAMQGFVTGILSLKSDLDEIKYQVHFQDTKINSEDAIVVHTSVSGKSSYLTIAYIAMEIIECEDRNLILAAGQIYQTYQCINKCINNMTAVQTQPMNQYMVEFDSNTFCSCKKGQYLKELRCYACHYSCSYCFNHYEDGCFECINKLRNLNKQPEKYGQSTVKYGTCRCKSNYYEDGNICFQCHFLCEECVNGTKYDCTLCKDDNAYIKFNSNYTTDILSYDKLIFKTYGSCLCKDGTILIGEICIQCHYTCSTCFGGSLQECIKCPETRDLSLGICDCDDGYFNLGESPKESFIDLQSLIFPIEEPFPPEEFLQDLLSQTRVHDYCYRCHKSCKRCIGFSKQNCTQCFGETHINVLFAKYSSGQCECPDKYFLTSEIKCHQCESGCKKCFAQTAGNCYECMPSYNLEGEAIKNKLLIGRCKCSQGFTMNENDECIACHYSCLTCDGYESNQCLSCDPKIYRQLLWNQKCACYQGYYNQNEMCKKCKKQCETCFDNQCLICSPKRKYPPNCLCEDGYYEDQNEECQKCFHLCKTCSEKYLCLTCKHGLYNNQGTCICLNTEEQFSPINNTCIQNFVLRTESVFHKYNHKQYIKLYFDQEIFIEQQMYLSTVGQISPFYYIQRIENQLDLQQQINQTNNRQLLEVEFNKNNNFQLIYDLMTLYIRFNFSDIKQCQYEAKIVDSHTNYITIEMTYFVSFVYTNLTISFIRDNPFFTKYFTRIPYNYIYPTGLTISFGPYQTIDDSHLNNPLYLFLADNRHFLQWVSKSRLLPFILPTLQACTGLFYLTENISTSYYFFQQFIAYSVHPQISEYSYQAIEYDIDENQQNQVGYIYTKKLSTNTHQYVPFTMKKTRILGIFFFEYDIFVIAFIVIIILKFALKNFITDYILVKFLKGAIFEVFLGFMMQTYIKFNSNENEFELNLSWIISIVIFLIYLILIFLKFQAVLNFDTTEYIVNYIDVEHNGNRILQKTEIKYYINENRIDDFGFKIQQQENQSDKEYQEVIEQIQKRKQKSFRPFLNGIHTYPDTKKVFKFIWLIKRIFLAFMIVMHDRSNHNVLLGFYAFIWIIYALSKVLFQPYQHIATFLFKFIGDIFYIIAIYATIQQEKLFQSISAHEYCITQALEKDYYHWYLISYYGWISIYSLIFFILCYLIEALLALIIEAKTIKVLEILNQLKYVRPKIIQENPLIEFLDRQLNRFKKKQYRIFDHSEIFNWGISMDNDIITIRWWSKMLEEGVRYKISIINKSKDQSVRFKNLKFSMLEYERKQKQCKLDDSICIEAGQMRSFEEDVKLNMASLSIYNDYLKLEGQMEFNSDQQLDFSYELCTSELKLLSNVQNFRYQDIDNSKEMGILYQKHLIYQEDSLEILLSELNFVTLPSGECEESHLSKFKTNFHRYKELDYYLELTVRKYQNKARIRVLCEQVTTDLIMWSGYRQVLEKWGQCIVKFLQKSDDVIIKIEEEEGEEQEEMKGKEVEKEEQKEEDEKGNGMKQ